MEMDTDMDPPPPYQEQEQRQQQQQHQQRPRPLPPALPPRSSSSSVPVSAAVPRVGPGSDVKTPSTSAMGPIIMNDDTTTTTTTTTGDDSNTTNSNYNSSTILSSKSQLYPLHDDHDPRSSSTQSLVTPYCPPTSSSPSSPSSSSAHRTLLLVYIHGFYGNDQSFQALPARVHDVLRQTLASSRAINSKVYPRYKTYRAIDVARDNFSAWLEPHEAPTTDVILIGHSMGGLLAADVALMPNTDPSRQYPFKHRLLGTISLDSPFLGLNPGIVSSGISSLFQPAPKSPEGTPPPSAASSTTSPAPSLYTTPSVYNVDSASSSTPPLSPPSRRSTDPYFDPPFFNDAPFKEMPFLQRMSNFASKHRAEGIFSAMGNHVLSHLEYGGALADYPGLIARYRKIRNLEDVDELKLLGQGQSRNAVARVRFVNYYTLSSGRPKPAKPAGVDGSASALSLDSEARLQAVLSPESSLSLTQTTSTFSTDAPLPPFSSQATTPKITLEDALDGHVDAKLQSLQDLSDADSAPDLEPLSMQELDPEPMADHSDSEAHQTTTDTATTDTATAASTTDAPNEEKDLSPLPSPPPEPTLPDLTQYTDKEVRKQMEKEAKLVQKSHAAALKSHAKAVKAREKFLADRRKQADKAARRLDKEALQAHQQREKEDKAAQKQLEKDEKKKLQLEEDKPAKMRKFCTLPGKVNGAPDPTWTAIYVDGVDEIGAHCGLFLPGEHFEKLVGDMEDRILDWLREGTATRAALGE